MKKLLSTLFALAFALNCYAADVKISDLPEVTSPTTSTAVLPVVDAGATKKVTIDNILKRGSLTQAYDAELTALAGLTFADKSIIQLTGASAASVLTCASANQLIGVNAANDALECKSTINVTIDDSAAQFKHADSTAALKISVDGATADKTMTIQSTHTDNRTFTLPNKNLSLDGTFNDGKYCTYASSGTVISCNADGGGGTGDFKADGTVPMTAAIDLSTANAANSAGEFGYASNAFSWYANSEDFTATAGSNLWTFASGTSATFAFTPSVALNGGFSAVGSNTVSNGATSAGYIYFKEDSDNGTNTAQLIGPASTADVVITLPAETGTVALVKNEKLASFAWDNGASAVATTGSKRCVAIPYAATIVGYTMVISGDPGAGGTILNITKDAWSDSSLPTTEIDASAPPTVADDKVASTDSTLTGWTKSVAANDIICADVATNAVATWISLTIFGTK